MNKNSQTPPPATFETVWASLQETDRILTEKFAETDRQRKENERYLTKNLPKPTGKEKKTSGT